MWQTEKEIKILNIDPKQVITKLEELGAEYKGKYVQEIYTFDFPLLKDTFNNYKKTLIEYNDNRPIIKFIEEIQPCFDKDDANKIKDILGYHSINDYIINNNSFELLNDDFFEKLMIKTQANFSKWIRLRRTGEGVAITIKKVLDSAGEYQLDAVEELEFNVPSIDFGISLLENLGYFITTRQEKLRIIYDYKNTEVVIDKWPMINPYLEVEGNSEAELLAVVEDLGYNKTDAIVTNTDDVYLRDNINIFDYKELVFNQEDQKLINELMAM